VVQVFRLDAAEPLATRSIAIAPPALQAPLVKKLPAPVLKSSVATVPKPPAIHLKRPAAAPPPAPVKAAAAEGGGEGDWESF
jgi:hypothetical protein